MYSVGVDPDAWLTQCLEDFSTMKLFFLLACSALWEEVSVHSPYTEWGIVLALENRGSTETIWNSVDWSLCPRSIYSSMYICMGSWLFISHLGHTITTLFCCPNCSNFGQLFQLAFGVPLSFVFIHLLLSASLLSGSQLIWYISSPVLGSFFLGTLVNGIRIKNLGCNHGYYCWAIISSKCCQLTQ